MSNKDDKGYERQWGRLFPVKACFLFVKIFIILLDDHIHSFYKTMDWIIMLLQAHANRHDPKFFEF